MNSTAPHLRPAATFFGAPVADIEDLRPGDIAAVGVYCDHFSAGRPGGRFAARQLRYSSTALRTPAPSGVVDLGDFNVFPLEPQRTHDILSDQARRLFATGAKLFAIGGDFSVTPAFLAGTADEAEKTSIGMVRISRRLDLMPVAMKPAPGPWRRSATGEIADLLSAGPPAVALIGARGLAAVEERDGLSDMTVVSAEEIKSTSAAGVLRGRKALEAAADRFYLSVDVDVLEPRFGSVALPGTQGGLSLDQLVNVLAVFEDMPFVGAELTGHVPDLDVPGRLATKSLANIAAKILHCLSEDA